MTEMDIRLVRARSHLVLDHPFFGTLAMRLRLREHNNLQSKTMATDGSFLYYCREFLDRVDAATLLFAVTHEVMHCALGHHVRRGTRDPLLWNIACDYVVNLLLKAAGFKLPDWVFYDTRFAKLNAEQVYRILLKEKQDQQQQQQQQPQTQPGQGPGQGQDDDEDDNDNEDEEGDGECDSNTSDEDVEDTDQASSSGSQTEADEDGGMDGKSSTSQDGNAKSGNGSSSADQSTEEPGDSSGSSGGTSTQSSNDLPQSYGDPGGCGEILDAAPPHDQAALDEAAEEWQVYTRQAVNVARRAGEGRLPGFLEEVIDSLNEPHTDWRQTFREWVDSPNTKDYTWTQPNRRMFALGYITPGTISDGVHKVAFIIDSSGSVDHDWLKIFGGEGQAALDDGAIDQAIVLFVDDIVHPNIQEYSRGEIIDWTVQGRGGTRFSPAFSWLVENVPELTGAVYFTDLDSTDFGEPPPFPVLWAAYSSDPRTTQYRMAKVPFGQCIELTA